MNGGTWTSATMDFNDFTNHYWMATTTSDYAMPLDRGTEQPFSMQWFATGLEAVEEVMEPMVIGMGFGGSPTARPRRRWFDGTPNGQVDDPNSPHQLGHTHLF